MINDDLNLMNEQGASNYLKKKVQIGLEKNHKEVLYLKQTELKSQLVNYTAN